MAEKRISPAIIILPMIALGLVAVAAVALARRPEEELTTFAYVSGIKRLGGTDSMDYFAVDVQNTGDVAGVCTLECMERHKIEGDYTDWQVTTTISHSLVPGEVKTFGDSNEFPVWVTGYPRHEKWYVRFRGEPGEINAEGRAWE